MRTLTTICLLCSLLSCTDHPPKQVEWLIGTWKREGKEQYEVWEATSNGELIGYAYRVKNHQKIITETLAIRLIGEQMVLQATVPDQNEGNTVSFPLNESITTALSFENLVHDFPQKIQYKKVREGEIEVSVRGEDGEGFSYRQRKQAEKSWGVW